jgi:hypothetical protein
MLRQTPFTLGEKIVHARRPEWGEGVVDHATTISHDGKSAQRLIIRFANQGLVTLNTAVAEVVRKDAADAMASSQTANSSSLTNAWLSESTRKNPAEALGALPDAMSDPFASLPKRLQATLESFKYNPTQRNAKLPSDPRKLFDWAMAQTKLADPLSKYTRHELEEGYVRFTRNRDQHLRELVRAIKRQNVPGALQEVLKTVTTPAGREALTQSMQG